ncbi:hypothetical protein M0E87_10440 [Corynebacterium sp. CCM 9185]|uniref:Serine hydrolase n=1 Tax=Corynebacterium marambiense TaxID=2765364 RepID=A0ABS0VXA2_9CORY|nr:hypothetical protein [Corynebacterium marambiense]MBI9001405.1 hypothetical protein [Corynebacterium marambiense]MCK7664069.1 hypothetical protein [Corynebacterium marambiense]MCX7543406.1 hypothetical protein [Corynebacterium marambiense]
MKKLTGVILCASILSACTIPTGDRDGAVDDDPPSQTTSTGASAWVGGSTSRTPSPESPELQRVADEIAAAAATDGQVGVALADGHSVVESGEIAVGPAWSTVKVPVSMAVLYRGTATTETVDRAITVSDNAALDTLWSSLGGGADAAAATEQILRKAGDDTTVPPEVTRPGFSAAGQTDWALTDQARFAQQMTCIPGAGAVLTAMNHVADAQSYGLGRIPDLPFKGGWGPDEAGDYMVRQFGVLQTPGGEVGIALAVQPEDGAYDTGRKMLDRMALTLETEIDAGVFTEAAECIPEPAGKELG